MTDPMVPEIASMRKTPARTLEAVHLTAEAARRRLAQLPRGATTAEIRTAVGPVAAALARVPGDVTTATADMFLGVLSGRALVVQMERRRAARKTARERRGVA